MEASMLKMVFMFVTVTVLAFAAGVWAEATVLANADQARTPATISPSQMHLELNHSNLPVQQIDNYN
jgi:hypothetical protein